MQRTDVIVRFFCLMIRRPPRSTRTDTLCPYTRSSDLETYVRTPEAPKWRLLGSIQRDRVVGDEDSEFGDAELSADGRFAYRVSNEMTGRNCLLLQDIDSGQLRSEERSVGKECVSRGRYWWSPVT